jgi:hypothetical protein
MQDDCHEPPRHKNASQSYNNNNNKKQNTTRQTLIGHSNNDKYTESRRGKAFDVDY